MTGFASLEKTVDGRRIRFQLKSLNHRFFELKVRSARGLPEVEGLARQVLRKKVHRGSAELAMEHAESVPEKAKNRNSLENFLGQLQEALGKTQKQFHFANWSRPLWAMALLMKEERWSLENSDESPADREPIAESFWEESLTELAELLRQSRQREGANIAAMAQKELALLNRLLDEILARLDALQEEWKTQLRQRLLETAAELKMAGPDETRVHQEFVLLCDKRDVAEETQRIRTHLDYFAKLLGEGPIEIGKKLDFLLQELHREWTTLGNKIQNPALSQKGGEAKLALERLKEQSLNLL